MTFFKIHAFSMLLPLCFISKSLAYGGNEELNFESSMDGIEKQSESEPSGLKSIDALKSVDKVLSMKKNSGKSKKSGQISKSVEIVAVVNGAAITTADIENTIKFIFFSSGKKYNEPDAKMMREAVLNILIQEEIQRQIAHKNGIKISKKDIDERISEIAKTNSMSVEQLEDYFKNLGINMDIFRKNLSQKLLSHIILQYMYNDVQVTKEEMSTESKSIAEENENTRWLLGEIHIKSENKQKEEKAKKTAENIHRLISDGFSAVVLASYISEGNYQKNRGELGWRSKKNIDPKFLPEISKLEIGQFTPVLKTQTGYTIFFVIDKANPKQSGMTESKINYIVATMQYKGPFFTEEDVRKVEEAVFELKSSKDGKSFESVCKKHNVTYSKHEADGSNPQLFTMLDKSAKEPLLVASERDENSMDIYFTCEKITPKSKTPSEEEIKEKIRMTKASKSFSRNFTQARAISNVKILRQGAN